MPLENAFAWSKSRDEQFRECQRKYYYDKYASWGGWDRHAPSEARTAYILKNLKNRWAWKGESVHHALENILKAQRVGRIVSLEAAEKELTDTMRLNYKSSKSKKYLEDPKRSVGLFEHEYEKPVTDDTWKKIHAESVECIRNFFKSDFYQELLLDNKDNWIAIEDLEEFEFDRAKIYVKLDFARRKEDEIHIIDWKTGKTEGNDFNVQMGTYALYAMQKWNISLEKIRAFIFNLTNPKPVLSQVPLTEQVLDETREVMQKSIDAMRQLLVDVKRNIPKDRSAFLFTENSRLCDSCNFYKICEKYPPKKG